MLATKHKIHQSEHYSVILAKTKKQINSALRLRFEVFNIELANKRSENDAELEFDDFDKHCQHLIVVDNSTGKTVGTYRLNTLETAKDLQGFYSYSEFSIEDLPAEFLSQSVEIGRACIAKEHRNKKVLFLLWKGLANFISANNKRYLFGCTSIFSVNPKIGEEAFKWLETQDFLHTKFSISPRNGKSTLDEKFNEAEELEIPNLFKLYLKIGAKICGKPTIDPIFGTTDFFVIFDVKSLNDKYRKMFFCD